MWYHSVYNKHVMMEDKLWSNIWYINSDSSTSHVTMIPQEKNGWTLHLGKAIWQKYLFSCCRLHFQQVHYCPNKKYHTAEDQTPYEAKLTLFSPSIKKTKIILSCPSDRLHPVRQWNFFQIYASIHLKRWNNDQSTWRESQITYQQKS